MGAWIHGNHQLEITGDTHFLKALQDHQKKQNTWVLLFNVQTTHTQ